MKITIYRKFLMALVMVVSLQSMIAQTSYSTNRNAVSLEYNLLFNAEENYQVTQSGGASYENFSGLFDGKMNPLYTTTAPSVSDPYVLLIEGLPYKHIQAGAWVGWTTRYWFAKRFKIEGYNSYSPAGIGWKTIVDYSDTDYSGYDFMKKVNPSGTYTKLRFTFYEATGTGGRLGISELFFLHPEATSPYKNLIRSNSPWQSTDSNNGITYSGNVGVGEANPTMKLELGDLGAFDGLKFNSLFNMRTSSVGSGHIVMEKLSPNGNVFLRSRSISSLDGNVILNDNGGNVGVGTSTPQAVLHIKDNTGIIVEGDTGWKGKIKMVDGFDNVVARDDMLISTSGGFMFKMDDNANGISNVQGFNVYDRNNTSVFAIEESNGNVGIGTIETGTHKLAVEGSIGAREIKVEGSGWSDFVFEENYKLPTLREVEQHIQEKGHLQDIPSAAEVAENGIFLGEMDSKLLQKIEELMLYTIEQQKELELVKNELLILKKVRD